MFEPTPTPEWNCPGCGYQMSAASGLKKETPGPGDITICMKCGELMLFNDDLTGRKPTMRELIDIQTSHSWPEVERVRHAIKLLHKKIERGELPPFSSTGD